MSFPTRRLGSTAVEVTELGFGAAPIGNLFTAVTDDSALATIETAWDAGVRYFDTAPHYGLGLSERRLGEALKAKPRDEYVVSTKVGRLLVPHPRPAASDLDDGGFAVPADLLRVRDYTRDGVLRSIDGSLERLGLDRVDIVYVHDPDEHLDEVVAETIPALCRLRDEGVVGAVGAGMNAVEPLCRLVRETGLDVVMAAGRWTLVDRSGEGLLDLCRDRGVSVAAAAPFNSGLLASESPDDGARFDYHSARPALIAQARALADECRRWDVSLPQAALQFALRHPAVASVVVGMRSPQEATVDAELMSRTVPGAAWNALERVAAGGPR
jgi:D-threo-aldose 1-dehydrogenase